MKIKIKQKQDKTLVNVIMQEDELLIENEMRAIMANKYSNLFQVSLQQKMFPKRNVLEYVGPSCISLADYLKRTLSKQNFIHILVQITAALENIRTRDLTVRNLLLDLRYMFINVNTSDIFCIYLPILSNPFATDLLDFFRIILHSINSDRSEDLHYIGDFSQFLKSQNTFSTEALRDFLCKQNPNAAAQFRRLIGEHSGFIANNQAEYYQHYQAAAKRDVNEFTERSGNIEEGTTVLQDPFFDLNRYDSFSEETDGTTLLNTADEAGTTVLNQGSIGSDRNDVHDPYLIRLSTDEKIMIDKPVFRLGKEKDFVDYFVYNNGAVSRSHANIITRNGRFYVMDLHTTNYTYVNEQVIPENKEVEIFDGNMLKLANEEFEFHVR